MIGTYTSFIIRLRKEKILFLGITTLLYCFAVRFTHLYLGLIYLFALYPIFLVAFLIGIEIVKLKEIE